MKVGVYVGALPPDVGGGYTYVTDILASLASTAVTHGHEFTAIGPALQPPTGWSDRAYLTLYGRRPARVIDRAWRRLALFDRRGASRLPKSRVERTLADSGVDLLWSLSPGVPTHAIPYVATVWDLQHRLQPIFPEVSSGREWVRRERLLAREIGQASMVVVGTQAGQAEVERFYGVPPERIRRIAHPTPTFALSAEGLARGSTLSRLALVPGYVFYPAQFWAHKNHVTILHALAILRDVHGLQLTAVFVGSDKGNQAHVRRVAGRLGLTAQVRFLGFVPRSDLVDLYRNALALAYMSLFGPENLPPLEAFALGCPVVASDVPGAEEQLGDAALLVAPMDESAVAAALLKIATDEEARQRLVERGHQRAVAYTPTDFVRDMIGVVDELEPFIRTWR